MWEFKSALGTATRSPRFRRFGPVPFDHECFLGIPCRLRLVGRGFTHENWAAVSVGTCQDVSGPLPRLEKNNQAPQPTPF